MCCFSSCSFPCWQNTLQNVLLKPTSQCFICFLLPSLSLLKASSMPAHELHTTTVPWSKACLQLEARDVTSAGEHCFPRKEYSGHSSRFLADGLYLLRKDPSALALNQTVVPLLMQILPTFGFQTCCLIALLCPSLLFFLSVMNLSQVQCNTWQHFTG